MAVFNFLGCDSGMWVCDRLFCLRAQMHAGGSEAMCHDVFYLISNGLAKIYMYECVCE